MSQNKNESKTKVSLWISNNVLELVDKVAESYGLSRSDYIRLTLSEALVNMGFLSRERGSLLSAKQGVTA